MRNTDLNAAVAILASEYQLLPYVQAAALIRDDSAEDEDLRKLIHIHTTVEKVLATVSGMLGVEFADLGDPATPYSPSSEFAEKLDTQWLKQVGALPATHANRVGAHFILSNVRGSSDASEYLKTVFGSDIRLVQGVPAQIFTNLAKMDTSNYASASTATSMAVVGGESPVVSWLSSILSHAVAEDASDVHFMSQDNDKLLVRFRVDGVLREQPMPLLGREREVIGSLLSRCATIDASDRTRPQDGSFSFNAIDGRRIDTRLAMLPTIHGPTIVVRLLDPINVRRSLDSMGFAAPTLAAIREVSSLPQGLILLTGPTGSGKTTTLYSVLNELDALGKNILTAEDPVEYRLPHIGQTQIRSDLGDKSLTFARAARAFLRLDPDIILVGEIRDEETAAIVLHAALTGHLVFSTMHTNSALGVFTRLSELRGEPFVVAETLALAASQRLIARVHGCREVAPPTPAQVAFLERKGLTAPEVVAHPRGCLACSGTGYKGRIPVMEVMQPTEKVRELVALRAPSGQVTSEIKNSGKWVSILTDSFRHVEKLDSTVEEMLRVLDTSDGQ
jgi:type II secretory ATPase GspE/PulE/Tfp pilus assembly ATPase PilB-like protein